MNVFSNPISQLNNPLLQALLWVALLAVPPLIVLLYFLKLKRIPLEVPSTYLWHRSIEDLRVNSIWQRLRQNLLLFLQLLLVLLVILALLGINWRGMELEQDRHIFVIDVSASMSANDLNPSRLENAKGQAEALIQQMKPGDVAMLVSFSNGAKVEQSFTDDRRLLRQRLSEIKPTQRTTSLAEALNVASGLANPGRSSSESTDVQAADPLPASLHLFSDGRFDNVKDFRFGNLSPTFYCVGDESVENVAILSFTTRRREDRPEEQQAFGRLQNYSKSAATVSVELYIDGQLADASDVTLEAEGEGAVVFDLGEIESSALRLNVAASDALAFDNEAFTVIQPARPARVLCVGPGNEFLELALQTERVGDLAEVTFQFPEYLESEQYRTASATSAYDLVIFDRCAPKGDDRSPMPLANTWFVGAVPPEGDWRIGDPLTIPAIIDVEKVHPLMRLLEMGDVKIYEGRPLTVPSSGTPLMESVAGPLFAIAPRGRFEDAVLGFPLISEENVNTDWPARLSFPMFIYNLLTYLGGQRQQESEVGLQPGNPYFLKAETAAKSVTVTTPDGRLSHIERDDRRRSRFADTERVGIYEVRDGEKILERFAVNLFSAGESDLRPNTEFQVGAGATIGATAGKAERRQEAWRWLILLALGVLLFEWYIYNRRIYL